MELKNICRKDKDLVTKFHESHARLNEALAPYGIEGKPMLNQALTELASISEERADAILRTIASFEEVISTDGTADPDLLKTPNLIEVAFRGLGLSYSKDFVATLGPNDVVDGYSLDNLQIFRNFRFMEICGYSLHDLQIFSWMNLFERSQIITNQILSRVEEVLRTGRTVSLEDVSAHYMRERLSGDRQIVKVKFHHLGPIYARAGEPAGFLASSSAEFVIERPERDDLRFI